MDVELPDGTTVKGVPDGTTKAQLAQKLKASGHAVPDSWSRPPGPAPEFPIDLGGHYGKDVGKAAFDSMNQGHESPVDAAFDALSLSHKGLDWLGGKIGSGIEDVGVGMGMSPQAAAVPATLAHTATAELPGMVAAPEALGPAARTVGKIGTGVKDLATGAAEKAKGFAADVTGKRAKEAASAVKDNLIDQLRGGADAARGEAATHAGNADMLASQAAKNQTKADQAVRGLPGVTTRSEFGQVAPAAPTSADLGDQMRGSVDKYVDGIKKVRNEQTAKYLPQAMEEARTLNSAGHPFTQQKSFQKIISSIDAEIKKSPKDIKKALQSIKDNLTEGYEVPLSDVEKAALEKQAHAERMVGGKASVPARRRVPPPFESAEKTRRMIGDIAFGRPMKGYEAIESEFAAKIYEQLSEAMRAYAPSYGRYLDKYRDLSANIDVAGSRLGKAITKKEGGPAGDLFHGTPSSELPDRIFANPENYRQFVQSVGGNKQVAEAYAKRWFANKLEGMSGDQARKFLTDNKTRAILGEMPGVQSMIDSHFMQPLLRHEVRAFEEGKAAKAATKASEASAAKATKYQQKIDSLATEPDPRKVLSGADNLVDTLMSDGTITKDQAAKFKADIDDAERKKLAVQEARTLLAKIAAGVGLGVGFSYSAKKAGEYFVP